MQGSKVLPGFFCGEDLGKTLGWGRGVGGVKGIDGE